MCSEKNVLNIFTIFVDRVEGKYAVCEMPDETMCDIPISSFAVIPKDRERYKVYIDGRGEVKVIEKSDSPKSLSDKKLPSRLIRF